MRQVLVIFFCVGLAACATPREVCISKATRDLSIVRGLISQSEANLKRGYRIDRSERLVTYSVICPGTGSGEVPVRWCERQQSVTKRTPVAIDLDTERRILKDLRAKERMLAAQANQAKKQCEIAHPAS